MKALLSSIHTISGLLLGSIALYGTLWSCAAGDILDILAFIPLFASIALFGVATKLVCKGMLKREPLARFFYNCYTEMK